MDSPARIAVVGPVDDRLTANVRALPLSPEVRHWPSLCADIEALTRFQPSLLLIALGPESAEEIGALRLLRHLWPAVGVLLITTAAREVNDTALAKRLGARLLVDPELPGRLAEAIEQAFHGADRPRGDVFVDLARGIADEVNNPLMFVAGHLQLLRGGFDPATERDRRDQVSAALGGVQRIQTAVDRLRLVADAAGGPRRVQPVDLATVLGRAFVERSEPSPRNAPTLAIADGAHVVPGDPEQIAAALGAITTFAADLANVGAAVQLRLDALPNGRRVRLAAAGPGLASWALPTTFEPYYPNRALRGQGFGMGLFLAQTVVLGHRGQATARRTSDGTLQIDFVLPA